MRVLVCGDRNWNKKGIIKRMLIQTGAKVVIHGDCRGADTIADLTARSLGLEVIPCKAHWDIGGKAAGMIRNKFMLTYNPDLVLAFHDDISKSKGTKNMIEIAKRAGIKVIIIGGEYGVNNKEI